MDPKDFYVSPYGAKIYMRAIHKQQKRKGFKGYRSALDPAINRNPYWRNKGFYNKWCLDCWFNQVFSDLGPGTIGLIREFIGRTERPGYECTRDLAYIFNGHTNVTYAVSWYYPLDLKKYQLVTAIEYVDQKARDMLQAPDPVALRQTIMNKS